MEMVSVRNFPRRGVSVKVGVMEFGLYKAPATHASYTIVHAVVKKYSSVGRRKLQFFDRWQQISNTGNHR